MREIILDNGMRIGLLTEEETRPTRSSPLAVGDRVRVTGTLTTTNGAGGTHLLRHRGVECRVTRSWYDYECGFRFWGEPVEAADAAAIRAQAGGDPAQPARVHFSEHDADLATRAPGP